MYPMIKTDCFVLRKQDFRDYDRLYTVYTREEGKISFLARSSKKPKSKLSARLETFGEVRINFIKGKIFNHLAGIETRAHNKKIIFNYERLNFAGEILNFFDRVIKMEEKDERVYDLLNEALSCINDSEIVRFYKINMYFFWRLIDILGYRPQLDSCSICGKIYQGAENDIFFNITEHILICRQCTGSGVLLKERVLNNLKEIFNLGLREFLVLEIDNQLTFITERAKEIKLSEL